VGLGGTTSSNQMWQHLNTWVQRDKEAVHSRRRVSIAKLHLVDPLVPSVSYMLYISD
jgi:hypothetical protein